MMQSAYDSHSGSSSASGGGGVAATLAAPRSGSATMGVSAAVRGHGSGSSELHQRINAWVRRRSSSGARGLSAAMLLDGKLIAASIGGTFAGGLHAVTGPDHLAALLPLCMGRRWWVALYTGAYWGLGHGIGAALVGALAFAVRGALNLDVLSTYMEAAVGISIMVIGVNGIRESQEWATDHMATGEGPTEVAKQHSLEIAMSQPRKEVSVASTLGTGILHGCSGSGHLLGVMPALAMPSWQIATTYLVAFGLGTMLAMSVFTGVVGELSSQMSEYLDDPTTPGKLAFASSLFALCMGAAWTIKAFTAMTIPAAVLRFFTRGAVLA